MAVDIVVFLMAKNVEVVFISCLSFVVFTDQFNPNVICKQVSNNCYLITLPYHYTCLCILLFLGIVNCILLLHQITLTDHGHPCFPMYLSILIDHIFSDDMCIYFFLQVQFCLRVIDTSEAITV